MRKRFWRALVDDGLIQEVGSKSDVKVPSDAEVYDASGMVLMLGLVDCHVHFTGSDTPTPGLLKKPFETRLVNAAVARASMCMSMIMLRVRIRKLS
jgi:imidazolonepropionase-like amidohydrolase